MPGWITIHALSKWGVGLARLTRCHHSCRAASESRDVRKPYEGVGLSTTGEERSTARLFVQGAAIVVSILLAFAIDAAWGEWLERLEEQEVLAGLRGDFVANQTQIRGVMTTHRSRVVRSPVA